MHIYISLLHIFIIILKYIEIYFVNYIIHHNNFNIGKISILKIHISKMKVKKYIDNLEILF